MRFSAIPLSLIKCRGDGETTVVGGLAAPFLSETTYRGQRELMLPTAFDNVLASEDDVRLFTDHSYKVENLLASRKSGNLKLSKSDKGLEYEAILPNPLTDKTRHIIALAQRGELGASVGWSSHKEKTVDGVRQFTDIKLTEISLTPIPAYKNTTVEKRAKDNDVWITLFTTRQEASRRRQ